MGRPACKPDRGREARDFPSGRTRPLRAVGGLFRSEDPAGYIAFWKDGTRNAEPQIAVFEASTRTTDDKLSAVVEMRGLHRHRRRGLQLQTRRKPQTKFAV